MFVEFKRNDREQRCRRCREPIEVGPWYARAWVYTDPSVGDPEECGYHIECAIDVDALAMNRALNEREGVPEELEAHRVFAQRRATAIDALAAAHERGERPPTSALEPARDRKGRPRVRVRFGGSLSSGNTLRYGFLEHMPDWTLCSSTREYVLAGSAVTAMNPRDDPSQPVVAALFATPLKTRIMAAQKEKLLAWRTEGLSTPVLWVVTVEPASRAAIDAKFLELRALLASVGYEADEAITVCTETVDASAAQAVASALDEHLGRGEARGSAESETPTRRAITLLREAIESERVEAWPSCLERAQRALETASIEERAQIAALAAQCASDEGAHGAITAIAARAPAMTDPLHDAMAAVLRSALAAMKSRVPDAVYAACAVLERPIDDARRRGEWVALIEDTLLAEKGVTARAEALATLIERVGDRASADRLRARLGPLRAGPRRALIERVIAAVEPRAATK